MFWAFLNPQKLNSPSAIFNPNFLITEESELAKTNIYELGWQAKAGSGSFTHYVEKATADRVLSGFAQWLSNPIGANRSIRFDAVAGLPPNTDIRTYVVDFDSYAYVRVLIAPVSDGSKKKRKAAIPKSNIDSVQASVNFIK